MGIRHSLTFGDVNTATYKTYISGVKTFKIAESDYEQIEIPGRNGYLLQDNNRYKPVVIEYDAFCVEDIQTNVRNLLNDLTAQEGIQNLTDTYDTEHFRKGYFGGGIDPNVFMMKTAKFTLRFTCQPERWLTSGQTAISMSSGTITNPTKFPAKPLLSIPLGVTGLTLNGVTFSFAERSDFVIDCEMGECYEYGANNEIVFVNNEITMTPNEFPELGQESELTASGTIQIIPRWWEL